MMRLDASDMRQYSLGFRNPNYSRGAGILDRLRHAPNLP